MRYEVYTDGACSVKKNKMASAYLIRTKDRFVNAQAKCFDGSNIAIAETLAVGLAVQYILDNCEIDRAKDCVVIRTDSESVIEFFKDIKEERSFPKSGDERVIITWNKLKKLNEKCEWSFCKIASHRDEKNGNKVADRLAKYVLRISCEA